MGKNLIFRAVMALTTGAFLGWAVGKTSDIFGLSLSNDQIVLAVALFVVIMDRLVFSQIIKKSKKGWSACSL